MKSLSFQGFALAMILTCVAPNLALALDTSTSRASLGSTDALRLRDLDMRINPLLGASNLEYSKQAVGAAKTKMSGGLTVEFGGAARKLETGLLLLNTESSTLLRNKETASVSSRLLTIPMMAKLRLMNRRAQSWYAKLGFMTAFETSSSLDNATRDFDVISAVGLGGRYYFSKKVDLIVEATYNRGLVDALSSAETSYRQGFLVLAGMSFSI